MEHVFSSRIGRTKDLDWLMACVSRAVIGHAASFWTWHSLCMKQGLSDQEAVEVMTSAVLAAMTLPPAEPAQSTPRNPGD